MVEFKTKQFNEDFPIGIWEKITNLQYRTINDFEFSYAEYRIGDEIFTEMSPAFIDAFEKEMLWVKLSK